ncbi:MAG TPA: alpha/beta hydrolase [Acidimicrobiales bacterium]|nr:alpha/beta hydrolase [Acidimicrobiales bacterium]
MKWLRALNTTSRVVLASIMLAVAVLAGVLIALTSSTSDLEARLLAPTNFPSGWRTVPVTTSTLTNNPCLSGVTTTVVNHAETSLTQRSGLPSVTETLAEETNAAGAFAKEIKVLDSCHTLHFDESSSTGSVTLRPMTLPAVGARAAGYAMSYTSDQLDLTLDLVLFSTATYVGAVVYTDSVPPPLTAVASVTRAAIAKLRGGVVTIGPLSVVDAPIRTVSTPLGTVGYRSVGSGPPLVLITGYTGTMEGWDPRFVDALAERHRVLLLDNAGIGKTSPLPSSLTIDAMANQTSAFMGALGVARADVLGWSMGAMIAQALAVLHPTRVRHLVLCATFPGTGTKAVPSQKDVNTLTSGNGSAVMDLLFPRDQLAARTGFTVADANYPTHPTASSATAAEQRRAILAWFRGADPAGRRGESITAPTLVADGSLDRLVPVINDHTLARLIAGARLVLYPNAGHAFLFQEQIAFVPLVESFLSGH